MAGTITILCSGDLHLGRQSSRLPGALDAAEAARFSGVEAWRQIVQLAVDLDVDLVMLSGDVVDRDNRYFESFGPLEHGVETLAGAQIPVVAVAGNHDYDVLPRLASVFSPEHFRLLGVGGVWERFTLERDGEPVLYVDGWSFPQRFIYENPLDQYNLTPPGDAPLVGMLHGEMDQPASRYAPFSSAQLLAQPHLFWLLGHIHIPRLILHQDQPRILYPGTPIPLRPFETGAHGPWLLRIEPGGQVSISQVVISPLRYEFVDVDLDGVDSLEEVESRIALALRHKLDSITSRHGGTLQYLLARLRLVGRTSQHRSLKEHLSRVVHDLNVTSGAAQALVYDFTVDTRPAWDLEQVARYPGAPGMLAQMLLSLRSGEGAHRRELLAQAHQLVDELQRSRPYRDVELEDYADDWLVEELERQGLLLLDELLAQKEGEQ